MSVRRIAWLLCFLPTVANASAFRLEARTEAQLYSIRSFQNGDPTSLTTLPRRRLVQYLGLEAFELITGEPIGFETSLRVFADWGLPHGESAKIDGVKSEDADLLYANVSYRGPHLQVRLGRQNYVDFMDITSFDGATVRYVSKIGIGAEAYAGLWVKGASILGSGVTQPDGIRESNLRRVSLMTAKPYAALDDIEPLVGAKILVEIAGISASVGFRQAWLSGATDIQRVSAEAKWGGLVKGLNAFGGIEYDLVMMRVSNARIQARYDGSEFGALVEAMRVTPVLSADSIFLYFSSGPRDVVRIRGDYYPVGPFRFYLQGTVDLYSNPVSSRLEDATKDPALPGSTTFGGSLGATWKRSSLRAGLNLSLKTGYGGRQVWVDGSIGWLPENALFTLDGRVSYANIQDGLNTRLNGSFAGFQAWGTVFLNRNTRASLVLEENLNPYSKSDTKVFFMLDWKVTL